MAVTTTVPTTVITVMGTTVKLRLSAVYRGNGESIGKITAVETLMEVAFAVFPWIRG